MEDDLLEHGDVQSAHELEEILGAVARVGAISPVVSPQLQKSQPLYAAGVSSVPEVRSQPIGGPDSPLTLTSHVNTLPLSNLARGLLTVPGGSPASGIPGTGLSLPVYGDYNWDDSGQSGFDPFDNEVSAEEDDSDDVSGLAKKATPTTGHKAVAALKKKMNALQARVSRTKAGHGVVLKGMALCGELDSEICGDLSQISQALPPGFVSVPTPPSPQPAVDMSSALNAINTAMGQLQAQYQQLLAEDAQAQGVAQQFANAQDLPGQTGMTASLYTMVSNLDQSLQNDAANVSAQIDQLNADLDNMNQQLANLATQQQNYAQEVANIQAQQQQINTPIQAQPMYQPNYQPPQLSYGVDGGYVQDPFGDDSGDGFAEDGGDM